MRRIILLLSFTFVSILCFAVDYKEGDDVFKIGDYVKAQQIYEKIVRENPLMKKNMDSRINSCKRCIGYLKEARKCKESGDFDNAYNNYLELLKLNKDDKEANNFLKNFSSEKANAGNKSNIGGAASASTTTTSSSSSSAQPDYSFKTKEVLPKNVEFFYMHDGTKVLCYINPEKPEMTYHEAVAYCNKLNLDGETGWRLPTMDEMLRFYGDYPEEKGKLVWVGYKGVIINNKTVEENEANSNMKYCPCIDGSQLVVHPFRINSQNKVVAGELMRHHFFPVKTK